MTGNEEQTKKSKKFAVGGGDLPPSPTTSTGTATANTSNTTNKRPTRHHVKRRSSGRVHVSKLAPMARAHGNTNGEFDASDEVKKPMKRSQSNKSLTRLSSLERKSGMTGFTPAAMTKTEQQQQQEPKQQQQEEEEVVKVISPTSPPTTPPPTTTTIEKQQPTFHVSQHKIPAAPIEQTLSVTADDLVAPDTAQIIKSSSNNDNINNNNNNNNISQKKPLLKSQFVESNKKMSNVASAAIAQQPSGMTRTQQKLLLQREQSLIHDENNIAHPKNMIRLTREMEKMGKEYRCVRKYQDPMMDSLKRCQQQRQQQQQQPQKKPLMHTRTFSSSIIPQPTIPHMEQRRQILLKTALQHQQHHQQHEEDENRWSASNFLDRLFFGNS